MIQTRQRHTREPRGISEAEQLLTIREVAGTFRCDVTTIRRWINLGILEAVILPHVRTRQAYRVKKSVVDEVLNTSTTGGTRG